MVETVFLTITDFLTLDKFVAFSSVNTFLQKLDPGGI